MRTKGFFIFSIFATGLLFIIFNTQKPESLQNIVTQTHQHIKNFQENLKDAEEKHLITDEKYLNLLGLKEKSGVEWRNTSVPAIVSYVLEGQHFQAVGLIRNIAWKLPNHTLILYDLGLTKYSLGSILTHCNSSKCMVINFDLDIFPSHVVEERLHAFRPLVIQIHRIDVLGCHHSWHNRRSETRIPFTITAEKNDLLFSSRVYVGSNPIPLTTSHYITILACFSAQDALTKVGAVIFLECDQRFVGEPSKISELYKAAVDGIGIVTWPVRPAVSSLTHPKMFEYFHTDADSFLFLPMVEVIRLVIVRSSSITNNIMMPWVQCALTQDCIFPIGAQSGGCRFDKKPQYRYSGCHSYDASAFNIVLGLRYNFDESHYTYKGSGYFFRTIANDKAYQEYIQLEKNSTFVLSEVTDENSSNRSEQTDVIL